NDQLRNDLKSLSLKSHRKDYPLLLRLKLLREQGGYCPYTGNPLDETQIGYNYQVDHIVPVSAAISCDALYNKVLCETDANSAKKGQTPYEWLHQDATKWEEYTARVKTMPGLSKKKLQLLTSANAPELVESWNGLAETAHLARLSQHVTTLQYGWSMQVQGENRRFFVNNGSMTSRMARLYNLYNVLHDPETLADPEKRQEANKKLRSNKKHHAIDAFIISFSQEIKVEQTPGYASPHWFIPTIKPFLNQFHEQIANVIPMRRCRDFKKDRYPEDIIYGYRERVHPENSSKKQYCMVVHKALVSILEKKPEKDTGWLKIWDEAIRADLKQKAETLTDKQAWIQLLKTYQHPTRHCPVKRILCVVSESDTPLSIEERPALGEFRDYGKDQTRGQFKKTTQHRGQLVYQDEKGRCKVQPVYGSSSLKAVKKQLEARGVRLYKNGMLFSAGVMVHVSLPFTGYKGRHCEAGFYKLKTMMSSGQVKLENSNGKEALTSIKHLVDADITVIPYTGGKRKISAEAEPLFTS
ncbi:MAG: HNH endonuclease domain-containing protein, partial [Vampirovibrionales bacterium]|nr:HNH endonuclease domain-containing protein [Vampirovibrionales bacterium]